MSSSIRRLSLTVVVVLAAVGLTGCGAEEPRFARTAPVKPAYSAPVEFPAPLVFEPRPTPTP